MKRCFLQFQALSNKLYSDNAEPSAILAFIYFLRIVSISRIIMFTMCFLHFSYTYLPRCSVLENFSWQIAVQVGCCKYLNCRVGLVCLLRIQTLCLHQEIKILSDLIVSRDLKFKSQRNILIFRNIGSVCSC